MVKSQLLYRNTSVSLGGERSANIWGRASRTPVENLQDARDLLLWLFTQGRQVVRDEIRPHVKVSGDDLTNMLMEIARPVPGTPGNPGGWEFLYFADEQLQHRMPELVKLENDHWAARIKQISDKLQIGSKLQNLVHSRHPGGGHRSPLRTRKKARIRGASKAARTRSPIARSRRTSTSSSSSFTSDGELEWPPDSSTDIHQLAIALSNPPVLPVQSKQTQQTASATATTTMMPPAQSQPTTPAKTPQGTRGGGRGRSRGRGKSK